MIHGGRTQVLDDATVGKGSNVADLFQFRMYPDNPGYGKIEELVSEIIVTNTLTHELVFKGRVLNIEDVQDNEGFTIYKSIACEGELAYLNDSILPYMKVSNATVADLFSNILGQHNSQVESYKRLEVGSCNVNDAAGRIDRYVEAGTSSMTAINNIVSSFGGQLRLRKDGDKNYLDLLTTYGNHSSQRLDIHRNIQTLSRKRSLDNIYSVVYPYGATVDQTATDTTTDVNTQTATATPRYTIANVNDGREYLVNQDLVNEIGWRATTKTFDALKDSNQIKSAGQNYLNSFKAATLSYSITAIDLQPLGLAVDNFKINDWYWLTNKFMSINEEVQIVSLTINLNEPQSSQITVGDNQLTLSQYTTELKRDQEQALNKPADTVALQLQIEQLKKEFEELKNQGTTPAKGNIIIDVSEFQKTIDWPKVVKAGLELAIIRVQHGSSHEDLTYKTNIPQAISAGANYATYAYFAGISEDDAKQEAIDFYNRAKAVIGTSKQPRFYMIDVEEQTMADIRAGVTAFMNQLNAMGVPDSKIVLYIANQLYDTFNLDVSRAGSIVLPTYGANDGTVAGSKRPAHPYDLWQYTSKGHVDGIETYVDMNTEASDRFTAAYLS